MKDALRLVLPGLAYILSACQPPSVELTDEHRAALADSVDAVVTAYYAAWGSQLDFDYGMSFFADVPEVAWSQSGSTIYGLAEMDSTWRPLFEALERQDWTYRDSRTIVLSRDLAYTIREATVVAWDPAGNRQPEVDVVETLVWVRRDGDWKVLFGHGSIPRESEQPSIEQGEP